MKGLGKKQRIAPWLSLWKLALLTVGSVVAVLSLYLVAPCWTFEPFGEPTSRFSNNMAVSHSSVFASISSLTNARL